MAPATSGRPLTVLGIAGSLRCASFNRGLVLPLAGERFDEEGRLTDELTRDEVRDLLVSLAAWTPTAAPR
jgi:NAD(P)H-dependent FMN reductase